MPVIAKASTIPTKEELAAEIDRAVVREMSEAAGGAAMERDGTVINGFRVRKTKDGSRIILEGV